MWRVVLRGLLAIAAAPGVAYAQGQQEPPPALVKTASARSVEMAPTVWVPGVVVSRDDAKIGAEVAGRLQMVAEVGIRLSAGDILARIDDRELKLEQQQAKAVLVRERARLAYAKQDLKRVSELADKELITENRLDEARAAHDAASAEQGAAQARLELINDRLARTAVRAPFAGVVSERLRRAGERVDEGDEIVRLVNTTSLEVQIRVAPNTLPHLTLDSPLRVKVDSVILTGKVRSIVPVGDDLSRLYDVRLVLPESSGWPAGTVLRVAVPTATPREVIAVPRDALVLRRDGVSVFRVSADNKAEKISVETGVAEGTMIEITGDIRDGDQVIVRGGERLRPGQSLKIMGTDRAPES